MLIIMTSNSVKMRFVRGNKMGGRRTRGKKRSKSRKKKTKKRRKKNRKKRTKRRR